MTVSTISTKDFLNGSIFRCGHRPPGRHTYKAKLDGSRVVVVDEQGQPVKVEFGATNDMRTCYARVEGVGLIGGWQYPHKRQPFQRLVQAINRGRVYRSTDLLPRSSKVKVCPHCGGEL